MADQHRTHQHRGKTTEGHLDKTAILDNLRIEPGQMVLDAGCGNGFMAKEFAKLTGPTGKVFALDTDPAAIESLQSETQGTVIEPFVGDITTETKLAAASLDLIFLATVLHGFSQSQLDGFQQEVRRLLKPNGKLAIVEFKPEETPFGPPFAIRFSPERLQITISLTPTRLVEVGEFFYLQMFEI